MQINIGMFYLFWKKPTLLRLFKLNNIKMYFSIYSLHKCQYIIHNIHLQLYIQLYTLFQCIYYLKTNNQKSITYYSIMQIAVASHCDEKSCTNHKPDREAAHTEHHQRSVP